LIGCVDSGRKILYCDELSFSPYGTRAATWARQGENQLATKGNLRLPAIYAIAVISSTGGLEGYKISSSPIVIADCLELFWRMRR
jgi:hypothetical protein